MIKAINITKTYSKDKIEIQSLKNVSFEINKGETVGLIGKNGAGKTTLLRIFSTLINPTSGQAFIDGLNVVKDKNEIKKLIGSLFGGESSLYGSLTAYENIKYFAELNDLTYNEFNNNLNDLVNQLNFKEYLNRKVENFSRGMKQKICFARSVIHNPSIIILDEPSTGLDIEAVNEVKSFINLCKEKGKTIIISSHNMNEIETLCDKIIILHKGKIIDWGNISDLKSKYNKTNISDLFFDVTKEVSNNEIF